MPTGLAKHAFGRARGALELVLESVLPKGLIDDRGHTTSIDDIESICALHGYRLGPDATHACAFYQSLPVTLST